MTVLFADLAGSTALGERLDPEDVRELQGELFDLINAEVERYGGTTEKFAGDAVLAVFGIPQAHEDDPERAVRAALAAHERFVSFIERVHGRHGAEVGLRIGVNTGEVVSGREAAARGEMMVSGDAVNVAARLQQHASPGEVLVGQRTQAATSRTIAYREHEALDAKGKSEPVACWVAVSAAHEQAPPPRGVAGLSAPLVGRNEELAVLTAVAARVERERAPQLVTLFGPAGVGKSRLVSELVERLPGARLVTGRCLSYGEGVTFWPLAEAAKTHAGILDTDSAEVALAKLRAAIESVVPADQAERVLRRRCARSGSRLPVPRAPSRIRTRSSIGFRTDGRGIWRPSDANSSRSSPSRTSTGPRARSSTCWSSSRRSSPTRACSCCAPPGSSCWRCDRPGERASRTRPPSRSHRSRPRTPHT